MMQENMPNAPNVPQPMPTPQPVMPSRQPEGLNKNLAMVCGTVIVVCLIISAAILLSSNAANNNTGNQPANNEPTGPVKVSMDDDAVLGVANAPVTMIEFSDYECPFCKRHFVEVFPDIKKDYIDTGKLKLVFRDFIAVTGHNPLATSEAMAAECAGELGGDSAYYKYHDALFTKTTSNGKGLLLSDLPVLARNIGLNVAKFNQCVASEKYKDEVAKDNADASKVGVNGTPSFFVGKSTANGTIDGKLIVGAQSYATFKATIDAALAQ